jgi:two-component system sensor histidine kinase VanS
VSARLRLTLSYAGFLLLAGVALIALLFYIIRFVPEGNLTIPGGIVGDGERGSPSVFIPDRGDLLAALWPRTWQVLIVLAVIGFVGGWFLAGRMLRPLERINTVATRVANGALDGRVRLDGPHDEFRQLADTFDLMLDRLQLALDEQRRFAANAAHELRTPYAVERSMLDVALADPAGQDVEQLLRRLDETNRRGIDVVEALLALASIDGSQTITRVPIDVAETVTDVIERLRPLADEAGVSLLTEIGDGDIDGSPTLIRQLVANLILNGIRHNVGAGGTVQIRTETSDDGAVSVHVSNTGPIVPPDLLARMTEPFVRGTDRVNSRPEGARSSTEGSGLGLALVARVADVHGAELELTARERGGLAVRVRFLAPG